MHPDTESLLANFPTGAAHPTRGKPKQTKQPMITIDVPYDLHMKAKAHALQRGITLKALVNEALSDLLKRKQAKQGNPLRLRKGDSV